MKKVIAIVLALVVVIGLVACATTGNNETTGSNETTSVEETTAANASSVAATFAAAFKAEAAKEGATANAIATALSQNPIVPFMPMVVDTEAGFLAGFDNVEIKDFKAAATFGPAIGSIAFISYVFELEADADKDAFVKTLKDNANLRWNICVAAEEMLVETEGNFVFFIMAPLSFEQPEVDGGEVEGGDIGGMEGEVDGPAAYDPEADTTEEAVEETTAA